MEELAIGVIDPEVLGTYGDTGNAFVLRQRALWRGIPARIHYIHLDEPISESMDIYVMGGGEDTAQALASQHLSSSPSFHRAMAAGKPLLAICASLQILGSWYIDAHNNRVKGVELLDITTRPQGHRSIGELVSLPCTQENGLVIKERLSGFENHGGATFLGKDASPLGKVIAGKGNNGEDGYDGVVQGSIIATYMHGPVLARNPELADALLCLALHVSELAPISLPFIDELRNERLKYACRDK